MASTPDISVAIILVNWNGFSFTKACLESLKNIDFPDHKIIVVDNDSHKPEGQWLFNEYPEIILIENTQNLGFTGGNNVGIKKALEMGFSHTLLLNNDTEVEPDFLSKMVSTLQQHPKAGIIQPVICFLEEKQKIWSAGGKWKSRLGSAITIGDRNQIQGFEFQENLDWATGCAMLVSRDAILQSGLLNDQYFAYFEDVEWSLRIRYQGFSIHLSPEAKIYHEAGASSKKKGSEGTLSANVFYWHVRNQFYLLRGIKKLSNGSKPLESSLDKSPIGIFAYPFHLGRFSLWMIYFLLRGRFQKLKAVARGIKDGLFNKLQAIPTWP